MATSISLVGLSCFLLSLCLVCSLKEGYAFEELRESQAESYITHTFETSSLFAPFICNHSTKGTVPPGADTLCFYSIAYGDGSISLGFFCKETLTMSAAEKINSFLFGCGTNNTEKFDLEAGILGLSQENGSIVFQTAQKYNKIFSYCLPSSASSTGHLTFGSQTPAPANIIYTKLVAQKSPSYGLDLIGIGLGGTKLNISESNFTTPGTIIDSGTVFTYLPPVAYTTFRDAFRVAMSAYPRITGPSADIDTCYDFSKNTSVTVGMPGKSSLITYNSTLSCLGFSEYDVDDDESIIGNLVQRTMEVVYHVAGQRIGFAPNGCT